MVIKTHQRTKSVVRVFSICVCSGGEGEKKSVTFVRLQGSAALMALELSRSELWCVLSRVQCSAVTGSDAANSPGVLCSKAGVCLARLISSTAQTTAALLLFLNLACLKPSQVPLLPCTVHP